MQPVVTRWVRCSGDVEYKGFINSLMQQLFDLPADRFCGVETFPGILLRQVTSWCMFHDSWYWDEDASFDNQAGMSRRIYRNVVSGGHEHVTTPWIMVGLQ